MKTFAYLIGLCAVLLQYIAYGLVYAQAPVLQSQGSVSASPPASDTAFEEASRDFSAGNYARAMPVLERLSESGIVQAILLLEQAYSRDLPGYPRNYAKSVAATLKAAQLGHAESQHKIGGYYLLGTPGLARNTSEGVAWMRKAAAQGHANAMVALGFLYHEGNQVPRNDAEAFRQFRAAADKGHRTGVYYTAQFHEVGVGTPVNKAEAIVWYTKAVELGSKEAQKNLDALKQGQGTGAVDLAEGNAAAARVNQQAVQRDVPRIINDPNASVEDLRACVKLARAQLNFVLGQNCSRRLGGADWYDFVIFDTTSRPPVVEAALSDARAKQQTAWADRLEKKLVSVRADERIYESLAQIEAEYQKNMADRRAANQAFQRWMEAARSFCAHYPRECSRWSQIHATRKPGQPTTFEEKEIAELYRAHVTAGQK